MKKLLLALIMLVPILTGCHENEYKPIEDAFRKHVDTNFDDPSTIKEIVSITPTDTFKTEDFKNLCQDLLNAYKDSENTADSLYHEIESRVKKYPYGSIMYMRDSDKLMSLYLSYMDIPTREIKLAEDKDFIEPTMPDKIISHPDTTIVTYSIKYRHQTPDGLKIDSVFANSNLSRTQILICKSPNYDSIGKENAEFVSLFTKACASWKILTELNCEKIRTANQIINWFDSQKK